MTADTLAQVIYANLIEQDMYINYVLIAGKQIDLLALANAILKAQSDAEANAARGRPGEHGRV